MNVLNGTLSVIDVKGRREKVGVAVKVIRKRPRRQDAGEYANLDDYLQVNQQQFERVTPQISWPTPNIVYKFHEVFAVFFPFCRVERAWCVYHLLAHSAKCAHLAYTCVCPFLEGAASFYSYFDFLCRARMHLQDT